MRVCFMRGCVECYERVCFMRGCVECYERVCRVL